jgi:inorganic pyrophosphatase
MWSWKRPAAAERSSPTTGNSKPLLSRIPAHRTDLSARLGLRASTKADDGDPLDIMVIHDAAPFRIVLACRVIDILQIEQKSKGKAEPNDRLFAVPRRSHSEQAIRDVRDLSKPIQQELEKFFYRNRRASREKTGDTGWKGPKTAMKAIKDSARAFWKDGE